MHHNKTRISNENKRMGQYQLLAVMAVILEQKRNTHAQAESRKEKKAIHTHIDILHMHTHACLIVRK